jgi:hypothetical protein
MLSLASVSEFPTFTNYKISITLLIFPKCRGTVVTFPMAKITKIFDNESVMARENSSDILRNGMEWKRLATFTPKYLRNFGANKC